MYNELIIFPKIVVVVVRDDGCCKKSESWVCLKKKIETFIRFGSEKIV